MAPLIVIFPRAVQKLLKETTPIFYDNKPIESALKHLSNKDLQYLSNLDVNALHRFSKMEYTEEYLKLTTKLDKSFPHSGGSMYYTVSWLARNLKN